MASNKQLGWIGIQLSTDRVVIIAWIATNMFDKHNRNRSLYLLKNAPDGKTDDELRPYLEKYRKKYGNNTLMNVVN